VTSSATAATRRQYGAIIGKGASDPALAYAGNDLKCTNCHINAGLKPFAAPFVSTHAATADGRRPDHPAERINAA
jgi:cytochrome c